MFPVKNGHDLEFTGACIIEDVPVNLSRLVVWLLWCVSVDKNKKGAK